MSRTNTNMLSGSRATLEISTIPGVNFSCTSFTLPGISIGKIDTPTRFNPRFEADNRIQFEELQVTFLVDEDLTNWKEVFNWMVQLGMPQSHEQYLATRVSRSSDGQMQIYSSNNNVLSTIGFIELWPTSLSAIDFSEEETETVYRKATATFSLVYYEFK